MFLRVASSCLRVTTVLLVVCCANGLRAQLPAFDHIVIVIEENHSFGDIIGNSAAPNINALAAAGANIVNDSTDPQGNISGSHAVRHPSQPNYFALFSGSTQGITDDEDHTFDVPTLASAAV